MSDVYPLISRLDVRDTAFKQYLDDVEAARRRIYNRRGEASPQSIAEALTIYSYEPRLDEDLLALAARCNIPYAGIASLNRLNHPEDLGRAGVILLPSAPGIFIPENSGSDLENLLSASRSSDDGIVIVIRKEDKGENFLFIPGADFGPAERVFFLNQGFRFPLRSWRLTSPFGPRINPVTGVAGTHKGLDLAAPAGTEVFAAREGTVAELGEDPVYGRYIIIDHGNNYKSLYGHLSKIETVLKAVVKSGSLIGRVGSTGQSTGPHLHFEIRQNGQPQDPGRLLRTFKN